MFIPPDAHPNVTRQLAACVKDGRLSCDAISHNAFRIKDPAENRSRYVHRASWRVEGDGLLVFEVEANAFLWRMVRSLVGGMIELEASGGGGDEFRAALEARDRSAAGPTAPAAGRKPG